MCDIQQQIAPYGCGFSQLERQRLRGLDSCSKTQSQQLTKWKVVLCAAMKQIIALCEEHKLIIRH